MIVTKITIVIALILGNSDQVNHIFAIMGDWVDISYLYKSCSNVPIEVPNFLQF